MACRVCKILLDWVEGNQHDILMNQTLCGIIRHFVNFVLKPSHKRIAANILQILGSERVRKHSEDVSFVTEDDVDTSAANDNNANCLINSNGEASNNRSSVGGSNNLTSNGNDNHISPNANPRPSNGATHNNSTSVQMNGNNCNPNANTDNTSNIIPVNANIVPVNENATANTNNAPNNNITNNIFPKNSTNATPNTSNIYDSITTANTFQLPLFPCLEQGGNFHISTTVSMKEITTLAQELAEFDWKLYNRIRLSEFANKAWRQHYKLFCSPNIIATINWFNHISSWVANEVMDHQKPKQRADIICHFVNLALQCYALRDFNSVFAVVGGLNMGCIHRLKETWENVPKKIKEHFSRLSAFIMIGSAGEVHPYRQELRNTSLPAVPYLGVLLNDISSIIDLTENHQFPIVVPHKIEVMSILFSEFTRFQKIGYPATKRAYVSQLRRMKVQQNLALFHQKSLDLEPKRA